MQIWPHPELKRSLGQYLYDGSIVEQEAGMHKTGLKAGEWSLTVTELPATFVSNIVKCLKKIKYTCMLDNNFCRLSFHGLFDSTNINVTKITCIIVKSTKLKTVRRRKMVSQFLV